MRKERISKLREKLSSQKLDAIIIENPTSIFYFTGLHLNNSFFLVTDSQEYLLVPNIFKNLPELNSAKVKIIHRFSEIIKVLKKYNFKRIGFHPDIPFYYYSLFSSEINSKKLIPTIITEKIREIKEPEEIELISQSCRIAFKCWIDLQEFIWPGITEKEVSHWINSYFLAQGCDSLAFPSIIASGKNSSFPHHIPDNDFLEESFPLLIDLGCKWQGYCSDLTRMLFFDKVSKKIKNIYQVIQNIQKEIINFLKPGILIKDIELKSRNLLRKAFPDGEILHSIGHGVGLEIHESPSLNLKNKHILKKGMVITIEPGIYFPAKFGARVEETVLITEDRAEILTKGDGD